jgi:hypothetical protein
MEPGPQGEKWIPVSAVDRNPHARMNGPICDASSVAPDIAIVYNASTINYSVRINRGTGAKDNKILRIKIIPARPRLISIRSQFHPDCFDGQKSSFISSENVYSYGI